MHVCVRMQTTLADILQGKISLAKHLSPLALVMQKNFIWHLTTGAEGKEKVTVSLKPKATT